MGWARDCIAWREGEGLTAYQEEILAALVTHQRAAERGPHGAGKTTIGALAVLWFALTRDGFDWKVVTTASVWRQLTKFLWPEIHKWARRLRWDRIGRAPFRAHDELLDLSLKLSTGEAFAVASDTPTAIEGAHAPHLLYLFDEGKAIPDGTFDAAEGAFSTAGSDTTTEALALVLSTPGPPMGRFYAIHSRATGYEDWWVRHVTLAETIAVGRVSAEWAEARKRQWGAESAVYQNRVLGEFAASESDGVIPLAWVEAANERWHVWAKAGKPGPLSAVGEDVARAGEDKTVLAPRYGPCVDTLRYYTHPDTMETVGVTAGLLHTAPDAYAVVDVIGLGAGVVDRLRELRYPVVAFNASERAVDEKGKELLDRTGELGFVNQRSAAWWRFRELLDPEHESTVALPPDDTLTGDLTAPRWRVVSGGKIAVEPKGEPGDEARAAGFSSVRARLKRSTDAGDAVVQAFVPKPRPTFVPRSKILPVKGRR